MVAAGGWPGAAQTGQANTGSHLGSLYPFVQKQADRSPIELSFLLPEFRDLRQWQKRARAKVFEHMFYAPPPVSADPQVIRKTDRGDYTEEYLTFQSTPDIRVPAYVLIPKNAKLPAPGIVALHDHGGFYLWGKEKLIQIEGEHPELTDFRKYYGGKSIAVELVRQGYVVIVIDMFYWGERRLLLDDDPPEFRERPASMPVEKVREYNRRSGQNEQLAARSLFTAGITWPGVMLWDDIRTVDYLASRPEVDRKRLACVGLSVGGYRSFMLAALDERIKTAVSVGWMTSFGSQIRAHVLNSVGLSFHLVGLYRYLDLPDVSALVAPRPILIINGSKDTLFNQDGIKAAYDKIARCFAKAGAAGRHACRLYDTPHEFNPEMQAEAWEWFRKWL
jgi:dienelactone hydrolase